MVHSARRGLRGWGLTVVMVVMAIGIVIEAVFLIPVIQKQAMQSAEGQRARTRQVAVYPVSVKLYEDAYARRVISWAELQCFKSSELCDPNPAPHPAPILTQTPTP